MFSLSDAKSSRQLATPSRHLTVVAGTEAGVGGSLSAIDDLLAIYARQQEEQAAHTRAVLLERDRFTHAAACTVERIVKPTFADVAERLNDHGGGGLVEERPAAGRHGQRVTLWMSLEGPVVAPPRADRNPYIQLEIDVPGRRVTVWEGNMWHKLGASRPTEPFTLEELTTESLIQRAVGVLRRSVNLGSETEGETK